MDKSNVIVWLLLILIFIGSYLYFASLPDTVNVNVPFNATGCTRVQDIVNRFEDNVALGGAGGMGNTLIKVGSFSQLENITNSTIYYTIQEDKIVFGAVQNGAFYEYIWEVPNKYYSNYVIKDVKNNVVTLKKDPTGIGELDFLLVLLWIVLYMIVQGVKE